MAAPAADLTARQLEILATTRELLARDGVEALSLGAVAKALGIKPPSLYKHFAGRGDLEAALIADRPGRARPGAGGGRRRPAARSAGPTARSRSPTRSSTA